MTVTVVYSQGPTETTAQDGELHWRNDDTPSEGPNDWLTMANATDGFNGRPRNDLVNLACAQFQEYPETNKWINMRRGFILFDTSVIESSDVVSAAIVSIEGKAKNSPAGAQNVALFSFDPASNTTITADDWDNVGETEYSNVITYANWNTSSVNLFTCVAAGIAAVDLSGVTKFCFRDTVYDVADNAPTWAGGQWDANIQGWSMEENAAGDKRPFITITHGAPFTPRAIMF